VFNSIALYSIPTVENAQARPFICVGIWISFFF